MQTTYSKKVNCEGNISHRRAHRMPTTSEGSSSKPERRETRYRRGQLKTPAGTAEDARPWEGRSGISLERQKDTPPERQKW